MAPRSLSGDAEVSAAKRLKSDDSSDHKEDEKEKKSTSEHPRVEQSIRRTQRQLLVDLREQTYHQNRAMISAFNFDRETETYKCALWKIEQIKSVGVEFVDPRTAFRKMIDAFGGDMEDEEDIDPIQEVKKKIKSIESKHPEAKTICIRWREEAEEDEDAEEVDLSDYNRWKFTRDFIDVVTPDSLINTNIYLPTPRVQVEGKSSCYTDFAQSNGVDFGTIVRTVTFDIDELKTFLADRKS